MIHADDLARVQAAIQTYLSGSSEHFEVEYRVRHKTGAVLWTIARGTAIRDSDGKPSRFVGCFFDTTDMKRVEERLRESEQRWRNLAETLPQFVWTTRPDGMVEYFSSQTVRYTGVPESELLGMRWLEVLHPMIGTTPPKSGSRACGIRISTRWNTGFVARTGNIAGSRAALRPLKDGAGRVSKCFGTSTEYRDAEAARGATAPGQGTLGAGHTQLEAQHLGVRHAGRHQGDARETLTNVWESLGYEPQDEIPASVALAIHRRTASESRPRFRPTWAAPRPPSRPSIACIRWTAATAGSWGEGWRSETATDIRCASWAPASTSPT